MIIKISKDYKLQVKVISFFRAIFFKRIMSRKYLRRKIFWSTVKESVSSEFSREATT